MALPGLSACGVRVRASLDAPDRQDRQSYHRAIHELANLSLPSLSLSVLVTTLVLEVKTQYVRAYITEPGAAQ